jgi:hypothetical protein
MPEGTFHIDKALTDLSIAYRNAAYVADRVYPVVPVEKESDKYYKHGKEFFRVRDDRRSPGSEARPSRWSLSDDTFFCGGHALKDYVPREHQANQDPALDLIADTTEGLTDQIQLIREDNLVTALVADLTGASVVDLAAIKWDADANNPIKKVRAEKEAIAKRVGVMPNVLLLSQPVFTAVRQNSTVVNLITGAQSAEQALVSAAQLAGLLELDEVLVAGAVKDTANEGQAASLDFVWGKRALLFYRPANPGRKTLSLGYTFRWRNALGALGVSSGGGQGVERYYNQPTKSDVVEVHDYYDLKTVDKDAGSLFINAIA